MLKLRVEVAGNGGKRNKQTSNPTLVRHREQQMPQLGTILSQFISVPSFPKFMLILYSHPVPGISSKILRRRFCHRRRNIFGLYLQREKFV